MQREQNPPNLETFAKIYLEADARLNGKIESERETINNINDNLNEIDGEIEKLDRFKDENKKQFVFRALEMNGFNCDNPIFDIRTKDGGSATVHFNDFQEGDIIIDLKYNNKEIIIEIIDNYTNKNLMEIDISLDEYSDRKRVEMVNRSDEYEVFFEGQLIFNKKDYYKELYTLNNQRMDMHKEQKEDFVIMKRQLEDLFPEFKVVDNDQYSVKDESGFFNNRNSLNVRQSMKIQPRNTDMIQKSYAEPQKPQKEDVINLSPFDQVTNEKRETFAYSAIKKPRASIWNNFVHLLFYVSIALFIVAMMVNWERPALLPICVSLIYCTWYYLKDEYVTLMPALGPLIGFSLSFIFDLVWLIKYSTSFWGKSEKISNGSTTGLDKFVVIMSYVLVGIEIAAIGISVMLYVKGLEVGTSNKQKFKLR